MKILIRGTNWIGDAVMSIPAMRELRRVFPDARITLHTREWAEGLFADVDFLDEIISFRPAKWRVRDVVSNSEFLADESFDIAVLFPNSFESAATTWLSRIPLRIGFNRDLRGLLLTDPIAVPEWKSRRHEVFYYLHLVAEAEKRYVGRETVGAYPPDISLNVSQERRDAAIEMLAARGHVRGKKIVALGAGSTNSEAKRWPASRFIETASRLTVIYDTDIVLLGSDGEKQLSQEIAAGITGPVIDLTGSTDIAEAAAVLSVADLMISNDMGLAHVAPAVGTPTLTIFGPTDPDTTRPFSATAEVIREPVDCSPCMLRECPIDHRCMLRIDPDRVVDAARRHLVPPPSSPRPAIFLDRDGTLIEEVNFLSKVEDMRIFPGTWTALERFRDAGYALIVVTNQSGIGRGLYSTDDMEAIHRAMQKELGGLIDAFYFCPHLPDEGCDCRKPATGMIERAVAEHGILLGRSWVIGDKALDIELGRNAGTRTALVATGYGSGLSDEQRSTADVSAKDIGDAAERILAYEFNEVTAAS